MTINYEIKSQLAKLLATEDLVVENRSVETACFDVETRVLTLPLWERASGTVYDMLVGHEVGHALFTPNEWDFLGKIPKAYVNVTEDARIEKLMKRKYPGLAKSFYKGYKELSDDDFFGIADQDITKMTLPDRINLHFKIGSFIDVRFTPQEQEIVDLVASSETFADAVTAAEVLHKFIGDQQKDQQPHPQNNNTTDAPGSGEESGDEQPGESDSSDKDTEDGDNDVEPQGEGESIDSVEDSEDVDPFKVETDEAFTDGAQSLTNADLGKRGPEYYQVPKVNLDEIIAPNSEIHNIIRESFAQEHDEYFEVVDRKYHEFKKSAQREVNYLVKEFECKKAADTYARATTARTGVLDCSKLHTYKYNEDLFKKVSVIPDGKNHGLIFILDWSGSMAECMMDTIKQLYNLVWFCNKVNIPFDVYAFTNSYKHNADRLIRRDLGNPGEFYISSDFTLMNLLTSKVNKKTLEVQLKNIFRLVYTFKAYVQYHYPGQLSLSGTPLNEALVCLHSLLPKFKKENNLQKVQTVVLTDGEAHQLYHWGYYNDYSSGEQKLSPRSCGYDGYLRNRKTGYTYELGYKYWEFTDKILMDLKQSFPDTNFIGIRLVPPREFASFVRRYTFISEQDTKKARKDKSYTIKNSGYESYFIMFNNALSTDSTFDVDEGESKVKIKSAFMKSLKAKTLNKKVLSQFMDLVC